MIAPTTTDASILSRVIAPEQPTFTPAAAKGILSLSFPEEDRERMQDLAARARQGTLTDEDRAELESYEQIGSLLGLLQSKARLSLKSRTQAGSDEAGAANSGLEACRIGPRIVEGVFPPREME